jgi:hypothetical protein
VTKYEFPSQTFPPLPTVSFDAGEEWSAVVAPGTFVSIAKERTEGFKSNIIVTITRHSPDYKVTETLREIEAVMSAYSESAEGDLIETTIGGHPYVGRDFAFVDPAAGSLTQLHLLTAMANGPYLDLVHLSGTCASSEVEIEYPSLQAVLKSARVMQSGS